MTDHYFTIEKTASAEFKDRGSLFVGYAHPVTNADDFKQKLSQIKKEHPKANHHCFAYRLQPQSGLFRVGDDGEPSGSAGRPILGQIDSRSLNGTLVVVVRYFGGTLLGVPGLINAYKTTASLCLQMVPIVQKPVLLYYRIRFEYTNMNAVMMVVKHYDLVIINKEMALFCEWTVGIPLNRSAEALSSFLSVWGVETEQSMNIS